MAQNKKYKLICPHCEKQFMAMLDTRGRQANKPKVYFGRYTRMAAEDHNKLLEKYGAIFTEEMILELDKYLGKQKHLETKYSDHYMAIIGWPKKQVLERHRLSEYWDIREGKKSECDKVQEELGLTKKREYVSPEEIRRLKIKNGLMVPNE